MANESKVPINLATGMEDPERVHGAFLVATAAQGKHGATPMWEWAGDDTTVFGY
jgi:hypothetical protein